MGLVDTIRKLAGEKSQYIIKDLNPQRGNSCTQSDNVSKKKCACISCDKQAEKYVQVFKCDEKGVKTNINLFYAPLCTEHISCETPIEIKYFSHIVSENS